MDESTFWRLIEEAQRQTGDLNTYAGTNKGMEVLQAQLQRLPPEQIMAFARVFDERYHAAYRWDLWDAAYVIGGGCGDDGFMDFRSELISRGRAVYEAALRDPETLADAPGPPVWGIEGWHYVASKAYEAVTGRNMFDDLPPPTDRPTPAAPAGERSDPDTAAKRYPRLAAKFAS